MNALTDGALAYLSPLIFHESAERRSCSLPLGGIYWADEIPDFKGFMKLPEEDRLSILQLFRIRFILWAGDELHEDDLAVLEGAKSQVPEYPLFQRLSLSKEDQLAQERVEQDLLKFFDNLSGDDGEIQVSEENGFPKVKITLGSK